MTAAGTRSLALSLPGAARTAEVAAWLREVNELAGTLPAQPLAFVVVTPIGMPARGRIALALACLGVRRVARFPLPGWSRVATAIRVPWPVSDPARLVRAALFEDAWEAIAPANEGEAWAFERARDHARIAAAKRSIRDGLPRLDVDFGLGRFPPRHFSPFHLADAPDSEAESRRVLAAVALLAGGAAGPEPRSEERRKRNRPQAPPFPLIACQGGGRE